MKKLLFIYNAYAGKGQVKTRLPAMLDLFTKAGWQVTAHPTQGAGDAAAVAAGWAASLTVSSAPAEMARSMRWSPA